VRVRGPGGTGRRAGAGCGGLAVLAQGVARRRLGGRGAVDEEVTGGGAGEGGEPADAVVLHHPAVHGTGAGGEGFGGDGHPERQQRRLVEGLLAAEVVLGGADAHVVQEVVLGLHGRGTVGELLVQ